MGLALHGTFYWELIFWGRFLAIRQASYWASSELHLSIVKVKCDNVDSQKCTDGLSMNDSSFIFLWFP